MNWQTPAALAIVTITMLAFLYRALKARGKKAGCGGGCACPVKPQPLRPSPASSR